MASHGGDDGEEAAAAAQREAPADQTWIGSLVKRARKVSWWWTRGEHDCWYRQMDNATSYNEWLQAAQKLDEIEGHDRWKLQDESEFYDANLIRQRLEDMRRLEADNDIQGIMFHLRSGMVRGLGGIGNPRLHTHAYVGTKKLIEEYTEQVMKSLQMLHDAPEDQLPLERKLAFFAESRHALGKTGLLLSGGASLGMFHFGVLKALHEHNLLPRVISGSSAGSIVAALVGTRTQEEMDDLFVPGTIDLTFFPPAGSLRRKVRRLLWEGHLMEINILKSALRKNVGDVTFYEAYERTGKILNITVSPANDYERPRLLNYLTSPNVLIWSAACASCAFPILYQPVELVAKNEAGEMMAYHLTDVKWKDGSLHADIPITRISELFNVNHFIVSQTNPHAIPFMSKPQRTRKKQENDEEQSPSMMRRGWWVMRYLVTSELAHRFRQAVTMGLVPKILEATLFQRLSGDITIVPPFKVSMYTNIISNPTWDTIKQFMQDALRCTWPNISVIRSHCEVELMLDRSARSLAKLYQGRAAIVGEDAGQMQQQLDQVSGLYAHVPLLRDDPVGLLGQNVPACDDSLARSLSVASADGVAGAGAGRVAAGGGASSAQNSQGASEMWACASCGECVCACQDLLDSNPTTCSSVSSGNSQDHRHDSARHDNAGVTMGVRSRIRQAVGARFLPFDL